MQAVNIQKLVTILDELRDKCPWDKKQTIHSLRQQTIEEIYELTDTIDNTDWSAMKEELGDLLLHILFYSKIASEQGQFNLQQVIDGIAEKLIRRHPHIYGNAIAEDADTVKRNWERIKLEEGKTSVLEGIPSSLPSLMKAMRLQEKAAQIGFEWENKEDVWKKVEEEKAELQQAINLNRQQEANAEAGDLLFSIINYIRFQKIDADSALELTNKKFIARFQAMESSAAASGKKLQDMTLNEMDAIWNQIKTIH